MGDSLEALRELPEEVKDEIGFALERVQRVLHVFQKKSKRGIATPKHEIDLVRQRLAHVVKLEKLSGRN